VKEHKAEDPDVKEDLLRYPAGVTTHQDLFRAMDPGESYTVGSDNMPFSTFAAASVGLPLRSTGAFSRPQQSDAVMPRRALCCREPTSKPLRPSRPFLCGF
jgi:hypothetical protein